MTASATTDNLPLSHWLLELVSPDIHRRQRASDVLMNLYGASMESHPGDAPAEHFGRLVRDAATSPGFDTRAFILALTDLMPSAQAQRMDLYHQDTARFNRIVGRIDQQLDAKPDRRRRKALQNRRTRALRASVCDTRSTVAQHQSMLLSQQVTAGFVFTALDELLLLAPDRLRTLLRHNSERYHITALLTKLGPKAADFFPDLLALLDATPDDGHFDSATALAETARGDAGRVRQILARIDSPRPAVVTGAASALYRLGRDATDLAPEVVERLLCLATDDATNRVPAIYALGPVTRGTPVAVNLLLALSESPDPSVKGASLYALGEIAQDPAKVIPRLIRALDDFEDPNPDEWYHSDHSKVTRALANFGPAAAPAVPALLRHLHRKDSDGAGTLPTPDRGILSALAAIGPAAHPALSTLERLARQLKLSVTDEPDDALINTIVQIRSTSPLPGSSGEK